MDTKELIDTLAVLYSKYGDQVQGPANSKRMLKDIINCRTPESGSHIDVCPDNHGYLITYNSCNRRGCPICPGFDELKWLLNRKAYKRKHLHLIVKLPSPLLVLWMNNRKVVSNLMFKAVNASLKKLDNNDGIKRGAINMIHTWGNGLSLHPHIHSLITLDGVDDTNKWISKGFDAEQFGNYYQHYLCLYIRNTMKNDTGNQLELFDLEETIQSIPPDSWFPFKSEIYNSGLGVITYLSKSFHRLWTGAIKQIGLSANNSVVHFTYEHRGNRTNYKLSGITFLSRILNHIPPKGLVMVRYSGLYSSYYMKQFSDDTFEAVEIDEEQIGALQPPRCPICNKVLQPGERIDKYQTRNILEKYYTGKPPPRYGDVIFIPKERKAS